MIRSSGPGERVAVGMGSNLGDREAHLRRAVRALGDAIRFTRLSSVVETPPAGYPHQGHFLNVVAVGRTELSPGELLRRLQEVEEGAGRVRAFPAGPRTLDADLLFYGDRIIRTPDLEVPHPRWAERTFVVVPLLEAAPDFRDPVSGRRVEEAADPRALRGRLRRWAPPPDLPGGEDAASQENGAR